MTDIGAAAKNQTVPAVLWALLATFLFALMFALPKFAGAVADPLQATWIRYTGGTVVLLAIVVARAAMAPDSVDTDTKKTAVSRPARIIPFHIARAFCGVGTVSCAVYAVTQIPLATAHAIALTNGVFVLVFARIFLGERISPLLVFAGAVSLCGGIIAAEPDFSNPAQFLSIGALLAFAGAIFWGCETTLLKYTATRDRPVSILLVVNGSAALMTLVPALIFWRDMPIGIGIAYAMMGPIAIAGQFCNINAYKLAHASMLVPVKYAGLIFAAIIGSVFFREIPSLALVFGAMMIVIGGGLAMRAARPDGRPT